MRDPVRIPRNEEENSEILQDVACIRNPEPAGQNAEMHVLRILQ